MSDIPASHAVGSHHILPSGRFWRVAIPIAITLILAALPPPPGLAQHAWYYFALFAGVIAALVTEPLPNPAVGLIGLTLTAALSRWTLFAPADLAKPGFNVTSQTDQLGAVRLCQHHGLAGRRRLHVRAGLPEDRAGPAHRAAAGARAGAQHAVARLCHHLRRTLLAPFTPSNTARGAGIIFPIVSNLPALYDSKPHDPSARRIGGYIMWTTFAADCVTSTLFMTACAPNFLARRASSARSRTCTISYRRLDAGVAAVRAAAAAGAAAAGLRAVSAGDQAQHRRRRTGRAASWHAWARSLGARSSWRCWWCAPSCCGCSAASFIDPTLAAFVRHLADAGAGRRHLGRHGEATIPPGPRSCCWRRW